MRIKSLNHPPVETKVDNTSSAVRELTAAHIQQGQIDINTTSMNLNTHEQINTPLGQDHINNMEDDNHVFENEGEIEEDKSGISSANLVFNR
jgi:hypothetical protein